MLIPLSIKYEVKHLNITLAEHPLRQKG
jgi:hypothetical protein